MLVHSAIEIPVVPSECRICHHCQAQHKIFPGYQALACPASTSPTLVRQLTNPHCCRSPSLIYSWPTQAEASSAVRMVTSPLACRSHHQLVQTAFTLVTSQCRTACDECAPASFMPARAFCAFSLSQKATIRRSSLSDSLLDFPFISAVFTPRRRRR